jgi:hypothetical protein
MPKKKETAATDPTMPFTEITIDGTTYKLCFDYQALADAELALRKKGIDAKLLIAMPSLQYWSVRLIFAAALSVFHPEIEYADALKMVRPDTQLPIAEAIVAAWNGSIAEAGPDAVADPRSPVEAA